VDDPLTLAGSEVGRESIAAWTSTAEAAVCVDTAVLTVVIRRTLVHVCLSNRITTSSVNSQNVTVKISKNHSKFWG